MKDIYNYNDFILSIKEGLIYTNNIEKYKNSIINSLSPLGFNFDINIIDKFKFDINVKNIEINIDLFISIVNNYGYYPSSFILYLKNGMWNRFKYDLNLLKSKINEFDNKDHISIRFESKYNDGLYKSDLDVPDYLYHITKDINISNIIKNGLIPKSKNRLSTHPDRIHFCYEIDDCYNLIKRFKLSDKLNGDDFNYTIVKVNCVDIKDKIILHTDPNFLEGCFTYDNIDAKFLELI
jgi:hypothetical protein